MELDARIDSLVSIVRTIRRLIGYIKAAPASSSAPRAPSIYSPPRSAGAAVAKWGKEDRAAFPRRASSRPSWSRPGGAKRAWTWNHGQVRVNYRPMYKPIPDGELVEVVPGMTFPQETRELWASLARSRFAGRSPFKAFADAWSASE